MPIHFRNMLAVEYKDIITDKFNFLINYFNFEPGDIFIEVLSLDKFERYYEFEYGKKSQWFVVGSAINNGRILILNKQDFPKKKHTENEFEEVILHELCHMFIRRLNWPEHASIWIQEGLCEYLSFGKKEFKIKNFIDFKEIETEEGWDKYNPYQQAGAFFKFLAEKYGDRKIADFIKKIKEKSDVESFKEVFGKELNEIQKKFITSLKNEKFISSRNTL